MPDADQQLVSVPDREPLTEAEARVVGFAAQKLARYRHLLRQVDRGGSISVKTEAGAATVEHLGSKDMGAVLVTLIEREEVLLASFGVQIERAE